MVISGHMKMPEWPKSPGMVLMSLRETLLTVKVWILSLDGDGAEE